MRLPLSPLRPTSDTESKTKDKTEAHTCEYTAAKDNSSVPPPSSPPTSPPIVETDEGVRKSTIRFVRSHEPWCNKPTGECVCDVETAPTVRLVSTHKPWCKSISGDCECEVAPEDRIAHRIPCHFKSVWMEEEGCEPYFLHITWQDMEYVDSHPEVFSFPQVVVRTTKYKNVRFACPHEHPILVQPRDVRGC